MACFPIAHIREQGVDLIIVPLDSSFGHKSLRQQAAVIQELQTRARTAGLRGTVVPVWLSHGRTMFIARPSHQSFFRSLTWDDVNRSVNRGLRWN